MEEVDQIIIQSFLNIGCEFADGIESLKQLTTENVVEATVKCLKIINPDIKMSHIFPPGMSARFRVGSTIAQACQNVGYRGNIGYQTFLYSAETDIRKIFMFLVEKLPRKEGIKDDEGSTSVLKRRIGQALREQCAMVWMPPYCKTRKSSLHFKTQNLRIPRKGDSGDVPYVHQQISYYDELSPSLLELNANGITANVAILTKKDSQTNKKASKESYQWKEHNLIPDEISFTSTFDDVVQIISGQTSQNKQSRFAHAKKLQFTTSEQTFQHQSIIRPSVPKKPEHLKNISAKSSLAAKKVDANEQVDASATTDSDSDGVVKKEETEEERFKREESELEEVISQAETQQRQHKEELKEMETSIKQMKLEISECEVSAEEQKETLILKEKTVHLLPNAEENMEKLKNMIEKNSQRLIGLGKLWEERRVPLIQEIRKLKQQFSVSEFDAEGKLEEIKMLRGRMKEASEETKRKEQIIKQLTTELESMKRDISRQSYTKRILEIVASIHKQQHEIQRVIDDTKETQKTMNRMKGRIDRTFTAADEVIFKDAKTDENIRQVYKYLVSLHDGCNLLIKTVEETGAVMREIRELEDQIKIETNKNAEENLKKILKDYKEMKKENQELMKQLKQ